jgi:hypothetical protein
MANHHSTNGSLFVDAAGSVDGALGPGSEGSAALFVTRPVYAAIDSKRLHIEWLHVERLRV